ncbi:sugar phosphate nucleotidyltransferase [Alistipes sp. ZOR0009]|uniref:sugar phosphate nucleotidyltransferase n=1 Tax=Alistipes sp. ZOR0009 TaxID=1339253 RepID=UPI0006466563|nr:sugar phosphate nucleotidyltransferase [Alistipes sp. ZOR0009]
MLDYSKYIINRDFTVRGALIKLNALSNDVLTLFVLDEGRLVGTLTDGDARRGLINGVQLTDSVDKIMKKDFSYLKDDENPFLRQVDFRNRSIQLLPSINEKGEIVKIYNLKKLKAILPIDAVLMAGGKGERLRPLTETTPKPLLKVGDKAIIDYNIESLLLNGVENISVTVNYLADQLEEHFANPKQGVKVKCVREPRFYGTMGAVKLVDGFKHDVVLIMNSDLFTNIDLSDFYRHFLEKDADMSVASVPYTVNIPFGIFELDGRNITSLKEKPTYNYYANSGIYLIKKDLLNLIPTDQCFNATDMIELLISKKKNVIRYPLLGYWVDIGRHEDFNRVQDYVKHLHFQ